jgi:hypothetical protein
VNNTASCKGNFTVDNAFPCLLRATSDELLVGETAGIAAMAGEFPFFPVLDGPQGIIPALPSQRLKAGAGCKVPFISGTTLDDGLSTPVSSSLRHANQQFRHTIRRRIHSDQFDCADC